MATRKWSCMRNGWGISFDLLQYLRSMTVSDDHAVIIMLQTNSVNKYRCIQWYFIYYQFLPFNSDTPESKLDDIFNSRNVRVSIIAWRISNVKLEMWLRIRERKYFEVFSSGVCLCLFKKWFTFITIMNKISNRIISLSFFLFLTDWKLINWCWLYWCFIDIKHNFFCNEL